MPRWHLTRDAADILPDIAPYLIVIKEKAPVYLYPGQDTPISDLAAGKVVKVLNEFNNWRYVCIIIYDIPKIQRGLVSREFLATREEAVPLEGKDCFGRRYFMSAKIVQLTGTDRHAYQVETINPLLKIYLNHPPGEYVPTVIYLQLGDDTYLPYSLSGGP